MPRSDSKPAKTVAPPAWQTAVTVLLILHLFCLGWSLASNSGGGKSLLAPALRQIPLVRNYLGLLWMDIAYDIHLASALPEDGSQSLVLDVEPGRAAGDLALPAQLPPEGMQPRIRRQRYQQLAYNVAYFDELFAENSDLRTQFPLAIAERWLRDLQAPHGSYLLTCRREPSKRLPKAVERAPSKPREGGPRLAGPTLYETATVKIHLVWDPDETRYQASRAEPTGQTAEVVRPETPTNQATGEAGEDEGEQGAAPAAEEPAQPADQPAPPATDGAGPTDEPEPTITGGEQPAEGAAK